MLYRKEKIIPLSLPAQRSKTFRAPREEKKTDYTEYKDIGNLDLKPPRATQAPCEGRRSGYRRNQGTQEGDPQ
jgi:hypothetical protein